ncbi:transglutaminase-like cysteine peptidase [Agaribacterium haliotis]|uniref:transglutaminase-like cysteine peptidase n=1 Tax=Agaribacterium haliotis TaxID=2013869 RepID=UPI000BB570A9|nr:transglutaminase-like cysteine peptidase [Agaribacterium haliotis]
MLPWFRRAALVVSIATLAAIAAPDKQLLDLLDVEFHEQFTRVYGEKAHKRLQRWKRLIRDNKDQDDWVKLRKVNHFFNSSMRFVSDEQHWQQNDYWATPIEFIGSRGGDCEDFSLAKYFTLKAMGMDVDKLRLMYVRALNYDEAHMVLIYSERPADVPLVLDNLVAEIRPATQRKDLKPIYSFNGDGLWLAKARGLGKKMREKGSVAQWDDVIGRIERGEFKQAN